MRHGYEENTSPEPGPVSQNGHGADYPPPVSPKRTGEGTRLPKLWFLPLLLAVVAACVAYIFVTLSPKSYRAEATLLFPSSGGGGGASSLIGAINGLSASGATDSTGSVPLLGGMVTSPQVGSGPSTSMAVLSSDRCRTEVARKCDLEQYYHTDMPTVLKILDSVVTFGINKNGLLAIETVDRDPAMSARITQAYIDTLHDISTDLSVDVSRRNRHFIEHRLNLARARLLTLQNQMLVLQNAKTAAETEGSQGDALISAYLDLQRQLTQSKIDLAATNASINWTTQKAERTAQTGINLPASTAFAQVPISRLRNLESQFAYVRATLGPDNPEYRSLELQVQSARREARAEVNREVVALRTGIEPEVATLFANRVAAQARYDGLQAAIVQLKPKVASLPTSKMQELRFSQAIAVGQSVVTMLEGEAERARIAEARDASTFEIIDPPSAPVEPYAPRKVYVTIFAAVAGLLLGIAWLVARSVIAQPRAAVEAT